MSKLNKDILFMLFVELQNNSKYLFSCLMVNRIWCEIAIPILWKNPWRYAINYRKRNFLYSIFTSYLSNDVKEFLTKKGIQVSGQSLAFDYLSFCRSINIEIIDSIISVGSSSEYNRFLLQEEIYSFLIRKCPEIIYLDMCGTYDIVYLPEAKIRLESLCELTCDTLIDSKYFYRLAHICQQIQRITIFNKNYEINYGTTKLIELQKNLKYFKWVDDYNEEECYMDLLEDPYSDIFHILKKHVNTLNHFEIYLQFGYDYYNDYDYTFLQNVLLELHNLKIIEIYSPTFLNENDLNKKLEIATYCNLEILDMDSIYIYHATCIIKNCLYLRELRIYNYHWDYDNFNDDTLNFIRTICENCSLIEYLSIPTFPLLENHFIEFEKLLRKCQNLRSLHFAETYYDEEDELEYGDYLSSVLIRDASTNLRVIYIPYNIKFSLKTLETFFENWKGRAAISIFMGTPYFYRKHDSYMKLINKYKIEGVIKYIDV
jgi:hypothetical protein